MQRVIPARITLLAAKASPYVVILRRKPAKCVHVIRWNTKINELEYGTWFTGKLRADGYDVSADGQWMIYHALGAKGSTWSGVCRLPFLRTYLEGRAEILGGGYFPDANTVLLNDWKPKEIQNVPFQVVNYQFQYGDTPLFMRRLYRDGWVPFEEEDQSDSEWCHASRGLSTSRDSWRNQPTPRHPALIMRLGSTGWRTNGIHYSVVRYSLVGYPNLLDHQVDSACWDSLGNLLYSRAGHIYKYSLVDLPRGSPSAEHDLEPLKREKFNRE